MARQWLVQTSFRGSLSTHSVEKEPRNGAQGPSGLARFPTHLFGGKGTAELVGCRGDFGAERGREPARVLVRAGLAVGRRSGERAELSGYALVL